MSIDDVRQIDRWGAFGTAVKFAQAYLLQKIFVHNMRPPNSVFATESYEHCTIHEITVRVKCEATVFRRDAGWIDQETIIFVFNFKNILYSLS